MTGWLEGRRALVIGAGSGIGRAVVDAFLAEGARVAVLERDGGKCEEFAAEIPGLPVVAGDATTREANEAAVAATVDAYGGLDVLVNCVGIFDFYQGIGELAVERLDDAIDEMFLVNVKSHLRAVKAGLPQLRANRGAVILTESTSAYFPGRGGVLYVSSKFAVRGLVTALAHELAPEVRVNGVAPGGTLNTDLRGLGSLGLDSKRSSPHIRFYTAPPGCSSRPPRPRGGRGRARTGPGCAAVGRGWPPPGAPAVAGEAIRIAARVVAHRARPYRYRRQVRLAGVSR